MEKFEFKHKTNFRNKYIRPLIEKEKLAVTIPNKPNLSRQNILLNSILVAYFNHLLRIASGINRKIENLNFLIVMTKDKFAYRREAGVKD